MRSILPLLLLSSLSCSLSGQTPTKGAGPSGNTTPTQAAARLAQLGSEHAERLHLIKKDDAPARKAAETVHVAELLDFLRNHSNTPEANLTRLRLGFMAKRDRDHIEAAKIALKSFDMSIGEIGGGLMAIRSAKQLKLAEITEQLKTAVEDRTRTITERMELVMQLKLGLKDLPWAKQLLAKTEAMASTDEQKAELLLGKARMAQAKGPKDPVVYHRALKVITEQYPKTQTGKMAQDKLAASELAVGSDPIEITAEDLEGKKVSLAQYRGKVLLIDFWATWCKPCMAEMPNIVAAYQQHHDRGLEVLGISLDRESKRAKFRATIRKEGMEWRHVFDGKHWHTQVAAQYDVTSIPFTVLIGRDGKIAGLNLHGEELMLAIEAAIRTK